MIDVETGIDRLCSFGDDHSFGVQADGSLIIRRLAENGKDWEICAVFAPGRWGHVRYRETL